MTGDTAQVRHLHAGCRASGVSRSRPELQRWAGRFLGDLDPQARAAVLSLGRGDAIAAGGPVVNVAGQVVVLLSGWVKVTASAETGRSFMLAIHHAGEVVDVDALAAQGGAQVTAGALTLTRRIPAAGFAEVLAAHPSAREAHCRAQCALLRDATRQWITGLAPVAVRVARTLLKLCRGFGGRRDTAGRVVIPLSQPEIAQLADASLPAVHRALTGLQDTGVLTLRRRAIGVVNLPALVAAAGTGAPLAAHEAELPDYCPGCPRPPASGGRATPAPLDRGTEEAV